ncbi:ABC transporter permease [Candidatus Dojkabacteria bacterium]|uniref:ABC transporter permease n=1 Tax=Candidatus Dojkabacteria bacterium TaxID=2099670 RepID=A0A955IB95_9BACT|nr:ABC transporter permease [Candidatus Dojkabacteria bacterium]
MIWIIAKREYFAVVKKRSFWISTLLFPIMIGIISFISGYSSSQAEKLFELKQLENGQEILVQDDSGILNPSILPEGFVLTQNKEDSINKIKNSESTAFIYFPENLPDAPTEIYSEYISPLRSDSYNMFAENLIKNSIISTLPEKQIQILSMEMNFQVTNFQNGEIVDKSLETFVIPGIGVAIFFVLVTFGASYMISSVSEEKESRMIEIILSSLRPRTLILGKLLGLLGVVITQVLLLILMAILSLQIFNVVLPINISQIPISITTIILTAVYIFLAFIVIANSMVGVGAALPTLKEAQGFSSIFIMLSIFPIYLVTFILAEPDGTLAVILSHMPLSGAFTILFRNVVGNIKTIEIFTTLASLILQVLISYYFAIKAFELGALKFNDSISLKSLFRK